MNFPASARIDKDWLDRNNTETASEWELVSTEINNPNYRDFFIGNGYVGQSVPPEGEGSWNIPDLQKPVPGKRASGGCQIHGFSDRENLLNVPCWSGLRFSDGRSVYSRFSGVHAGYTQTLNMRHGTVTTDLDWFSGEKPDGTHQKTHITTTMWLSRTIRNLGVICFVFTPDYDGTVTVEDALDGSRAARELREWSAVDTIRGTMAVSARMGTMERRILMASRIVTQGVDGAVTRIADTPNCRIRRLAIPVKKGRTYTVSKLVGIYTEEDGLNVETQAGFMLMNAAADIERVFEDHKNAWEKLWQSRITCSHKGVQRLARSALYQLYAQLRSDVHHSLGPTGITGLHQWSGRAFWDADLWVAPPVMLLRPELSKAIVAFRGNTLDGARRNAAAEGREGARYAWESIRTGDEICLGTTGQQLHQIGDIALVQWWYSLIADDTDYAQKRGVEVIIECARYYASRAVYNREADRYEIRRVCCADECSGIVDNNTYTNFAAIHTLRLASHILKRRGEPVPQTWADIAEKMYLPYSDELGTYLEHDTYSDQTIKQADTTLLIYPYDIGMTPREKESAVTFYRSRYPNHKIMMSSAIDGITFCEIGRPESAWECFVDLLPHFRLPCLHVSESPQNEVMSFATGLGGLLQLLVNGFAGIRITPEGLSVKPALPDAIHTLTLTGVHCRGISFDLTITADTVTCSGFSAPPTFTITAAEGVRILNG